jgi:hypothetical protein
MQNTKRTGRKVGSFATIADNEQDDHMAGMIVKASAATQYVVRE